MRPQPDRTKGRLEFGTSIFHPSSKDFQILWVGRPLRETLKILKMFADPNDHVSLATGGRREADLWTHYSLGPSAHWGTVPGNLWGFRLLPVQGNLSAASTANSSCCSWWGWGGVV